MHAYTFWRENCLCERERDRMESVSEGLLQLPYRILEEEQKSGGGSSPSEGNPTDAVIFVGISLVLGIACRHLLRGTRVPYTVALLIIGIALGSLGSSFFVFHYY